MRVNISINFYNFSIMENIIEPNEMFDFSKLSLAHPVGIQGGAYFTKIECNKKPLYVQTVKSLTRQGLVKSNKKYHCDLMFDKNAEQLIQWFEKFEEKCKEMIFEKKTDWFQGNLEESDIENAFNPLMRIYKSGKFYLLRTAIKNNKDDVPLIKIYDENQMTVNMNEITVATEMISILEIQGIKFTSRNFQVEIELKQIMVLDKEPIFESCLIKTNKKVNQTPLEEPTEERICLDNTFSYLEENDTKEVKIENIKINDAKLEDTKLEEDKEEEVIKQIEIDFEDLNEMIEVKNNDLTEIVQSDLNLDKTSETIILKKPNQVYFELYKEAREKAKQAKKNAIIAYLEAKNIKKTYMIENMDDNESDIDAEIDDVEESDLDYI